MSNEKRAPSRLGYVGDCKGNVGILIDTRYPFTGDYLGFRGFVGDEILYTQLNGDYFINHYEDHVFKQPVFHGKYPRFFFRGSGDSWLPSRTKKA